MNVALITGASKRIGQSIALTLGKTHRIIVHYHTSEDEAGQVASIINQAGGNATILKQDLLADNAGLILFQNALEIYGSLDVIINSASIFLPDTIYDLSANLWQNHHIIHVTVPTLLTHSLIKHYIDNKIDKIGNIIHIIDQRFKSPTPQFFSYTASKMFMASLTKQSAIACSPYIRVNAIAPGSTLPSPRQSYDDFITQASLTPMGYPVQLADINNAVEFILNSHSVTGEIITLDSGQNFDWRTVNFLKSKE